MLSILGLSSYPFTLSISVNVGTIQISLPNLEVIPSDFLLYSDKVIYLNLLKQKKPEFFVVQSNSLESVKKLISCTNGLYKKKENSFKQKSRNIFNKSELTYSAYIYYFDYKKLPDCYFE